MIESGDEILPAGSFVPHGVAECPRCHRGMRIEQAHTVEQKAVMLMLACPNGCNQMTAVSFPATEYAA